MSVFVMQWFWAKGVDDFGQPIWGIQKNSYTLRSREQIRVWSVLKMTNELNFPKSMVEISIRLLTSHLLLV